MPKYKKKTRVEKSCRINKERLRDDLLCVLGQCCCDRRHNGIGCAMHISDLFRVSTMAGCCLPQFIPGLPLPLLWMSNQKRIMVIWLESQCQHHSVQFPARIHYTGSRQLFHSIRHATQIYVYNVCVCVETECHLSFNVISPTVAENSSFM